MKTYSQLPRVEIELPQGELTRDSMQDPCGFPPEIFRGGAWDGLFIHEPYYRFIHLTPTDVVTHSNLEIFLRPENEGWKTEYPRMPVEAALWLEMFGVDPKSTTWAPHCDLLEGSPRVKRDPNPLPSSIYFIVAEECKRVKIGWAYDVNKRCRELQTACPFKLTIAATMLGGPGDEAELHQKFKRARILSRNEWFHLSPEIVEFIQSIQPLGA